MISICDFRRSNFCRLLLCLAATQFPLLAQLTDACTVSVLNRNVNVAPDGTWVLSNLPIGQGLVRARATCILTGLTKFGQSDLFTIPQDGSITLTPIIFGPITPIPDSLTLTAPVTSLGTIGATTQLTVTAAYANGTTADVSAGSIGTTYTTSNPAIATVSGDGLVTVTGGGQALITAFNEGTSGTIAINAGIAPSISITAPVDGANIVAGSTVPVTVSTSGNVAFVKFLVNGQNQFTSTFAPFVFDFIVPPNASTVVLGAIADDGIGNIGTAPTVTIKVIPDPGTTVTGSVVDSTNTAVPGATVTTLGNHQAVTAPDGTFSIPGVPTAQGNITVSASVTLGGGQSLSGSSGAVPPVPGGVTNVGTITVRQASFQSNYGVQQTLCDDCVVTSTLPFPFPFFGSPQTTAYVSNNGNIGFSSADGTPTESVAGFANQPRIAPFWTDLIPANLSGGGSGQSGLYINDQIPGLYLVTYLHEQEYCCFGDNTVQVVLFSNGQIAFLYNGVTTVHALVGITSGPGSQLPAQQVNFLTSQASTLTGPGTMFQLFTSTSPFNLDNGFLLWIPNGTGYDVITVPPVPPAGTGTVTGVAQNPQGPIANAQVAITSSTNLSFQGQATTDSQGNFSVSGVPYGGVTAIVTLGGQVVARGAAILVNPNPGAPPGGGSTGGTVQVIANGPVVTPPKTTP